MDYPRLSTLTTTLDLQQKATALVAWALASDSTITDDPLGDFRARGHGRYLPHVKAAQDAITSTDAGVALHPLVTAFVGDTDHQSLIGRLDLVAFNLAGAGRLQVGTLEASEVTEGAVKPVAFLTFAVAGGTPQTVVAQIVVSNEAVRALDPGTQDAIRAVLTSAVAVATDVALVDVLTAGTPASAATPEVLLAAISGGQPRRPYLIGGWDVLLGLPVGTLRDLRELGVGILPSASAAGQLIALDAAGLLVGDDGVIVETAKHANLLMDDGASPAGTTTLNLWQRDMSCLRAERFLRFAVRDGAVAFASA